MKQETLEEAMESYLDSPLPHSYKRAVEFGAKWQQQNSYSEEVICKHCKKPISVKDINNHLFMAIKDGGLIHWNCKTI